MSSEGIYLEPLIPWGWVATACTALLLFFLVLEWRKRPRFQIWRIIALFALFVGISGALLRPYYFFDRLAKPILLLTPNYSKQTADSLTSLYALEVILHPDAEDYDNGRKLTTINELDELKTRIHFVAGDGIPVSVLQSSPEISFQFLSSSSPKGITELNVPTFYIGEPQQLTGRVSAGEGSRTLRLIGPGGLEDSTRLKNGQTNFALQLKPKQQGRFTYQLELKEGTEQRVEKIPVDVLPARKLKVLFLQRAPSFEMRYLKNYLVEKGHALTLRYLVSKNTHRFEFANQPRQPFQRISASLLQDFDLVMIAPAAVQDLSSFELTQLKESIKNGLGVLFLLESAKLPSHINSFLPLNLKAVKSDTAQLSHFSWQNHLTVSAVPVRPEGTPALRTIWADEMNLPLSGYLASGLGKIGFQFVTETYHLALEGKRDVFALIWSTLLSNISRTHETPSQILLQTSEPRFVHQPISVDVIASQEIPELFLDNQFLPLREDECIDDLWSSTIWINQPGWHQLATQDSSVLNFYAHDRGEWPTLALSHQLRENKKHASASIEMKEEAMKSKVSVSPFLFLFTFLLAAGFLWLSPKL